MLLMSSRFMTCNVLPLHRPQAELLVADADTTLTVSGNGDVLEPHDGVMGECVYERGGWGARMLHA